MKLPLETKLTDSDFGKGEKVYLTEVSRFASRGVLLNKQNQVAMMYMGKLGCYKLPGGGIESGETKEEAFIREIKEETGYPCYVIRELGYIEEHKRRNRYLQVSYCYLARTAGPPGKRQLTVKESDLQFRLIWMELQEAIQAIVDSLHSCVDYSMQFMLTRDKRILEYVRSMSKEGQLE